MEGAGGQYVLAPPPTAFRALRLNFMGGMLLPSLPRRFPVALVLWTVTVLASSVPDTLAARETGVDVIGLTLLRPADWAVGVEALAAGGVDTRPVDDARAAPAPAPTPDDAPARRSNARTCDV